MSIFDQINKKPSVTSTVPQNQSTQVSSKEKLENLKVELLEVNPEMVFKNPPTSSEILQRIEQVSHQILHQAITKHQEANPRNRWADKLLVTASLPDLGNLMEQKLQPYQQEMLPPQAQRNLRKLKRQLKSHQK